jgi:hypothetical protein
MKLTGKCKQDFQNWLRPDILSEHRYSELITNCFSGFPSSMQYGVYVDFFDWAGIIIRVEYNHRYKNYWFNLNSGVFSHNELNRWNHRETARNAAIEKANEIYNSSL